MEFNAEPPEPSFDGGALDGGSAQVGSNDAMSSLG